MILKCQVCKQNHHFSIKQETTNTKRKTQQLKVLGTSHTDIVVATYKHKGNSWIADQSFATKKPYDATYVFTSFLICLNLGRNKSNAPLSVKKPFANSNYASMSLGLYSFHEEIEFGGDETFGISSPSSKLAMIKSIPPNLQMSDETRAF